MSWLRDEYGEVKVSWLFAGIAALALLITVVGLTIRLSGDCVDTVPAYDGRCWGDRSLVIEQGVAVCHCRRQP